MGASLLHIPGLHRRWGRRRARYAKVRWLFLRSLGVVYGVAFTSLGAQVLGLYGRRGILPLSEFLTRVKERFGRERFRLLPTVFWGGDSDRALKGWSRAGQLLSLALLFNIAPKFSAFALWAIYLSFCSVGREFLSFQWDVLLLESGLLAALQAPGGFRPGLGRALPSGVQVALMRWLLFRLYFGSGSAKLLSGDPTWRKLAACDCYYQTEPLPNRVGWHAHHLPARYQRFSTLAVLAVECGTPFLALGPRPVRLFAFGVLTGLQKIFALTGNYGFFNLLSFVLGFWLLDDQSLDRLLPLTRRLPAPSKRPSPGRVALDLALGAPFLLWGAVGMAQRFSRGRRMLRRLGPATQWLERSEELAAPLRMVNSYGLFAVMTTTRPEIVIEGSDDGLDWREYDFRFKPGKLSQVPRQVAPHQPRLDWQMWFAALSSPPRWFSAFLVRLLEGSAEVLALLKENPFPEHPPRYVRALLYDYRMTRGEPHRKTGNWWERELLGLYFPAISLAPREP